MRFVDEEYNLARLDGALVLVKKLAVATESRSEPHLTDSIDEELIFVVPTRFKNNKDQWLIFPGAPQAFVEWNNQQATKNPVNLQNYANVLNDVTTLRQDTGHDLHGHIEGYENYYLHNAEGKRVRCFQSFPLVNVLDKTVKAFGAVNIHCDQKTFLGGNTSDITERRQRLFAGLIAPIVFDISSVAHRWFEIAKGDYMEI
jgi:hypothetical protein